MARMPPAQVITANMLVSGRVVWLTASGGWSFDLRNARVFDDPALAEAALSRVQAQADRVVGCYLVTVRPTPAGPEPVHFRETFRRDGPSPAARIPAKVDADV